MANQVGVGSIGRVDERKAWRVWDKRTRMDKVWGPTMDLVEKAREARREVSHRVVAGSDGDD